MRCFGQKARSLHCKIILLDEQELVHEVHPNVTGQDLLAVVFQHLNLIETAYFGLRFLDLSRQSQWLDPNKKVVRQLKGGGPHTLYFGVKFYAVDPCKLLEEITRYQFFLQVKQDVLQGRLPVAQDTSAELAALALQSELGDFDPLRHRAGYVSEFRFLAHQTVDLEAKIAEMHKSLRGLVPAAAEMRYLDKVKWMDLYGVDLHPVLGEDTVEYFLGLTPSGIMVLRNKTKVGNYFWPRISKVYFKGRYFMLRVRDKNNDESTYGFETPSKEACKSLYRCSSQHLAFFRLVQMAGPPTSKLTHFAGRCAELRPRSPPKFRRFPSRRHRRIIDGTSEPPANDESNSDSDKTVDAKSTTQLSPYNQKTAESPLSQRSGVSRSRNRSRSISRSHRDHSADSRDDGDSRSQRRRRHRSRSRQASDNESEVSGVSNSSQSSRRRRRHRSRDSSASETESQSSRSHRSRRNRRRGSQGSTYELVDSESQWKEIQMKQGQGQAHCIPTASSIPLHPVQQATVRKAAGDSINVGESSLSSGQFSPLRSDMSRINGDTESEASSHRPRQHRKHHRHHRNRSHSSDKANLKRPLPADIMPHLYFGLLDPPTGVTQDQLREIPYEVVNAETGLGNNTHTNETANSTLNRKRLRPPPIQSDSKIVSVDNDSPPPPYSPPQTAVETLIETIASLELIGQGTDTKTNDASPPPVPPRSTPSPQVQAAPIQSKLNRLNSPVSPPSVSSPYYSHHHQSATTHPSPASPPHQTGPKFPKPQFIANGPVTPASTPTCSRLANGQLPPSFSPLSQSSQYNSMQNASPVYQSPSPHAVGLPLGGYSVPRTNNSTMFPGRLVPSVVNSGPSSLPSGYTPMTLPRVNVSSASLTHENCVSSSDKSKVVLPVSPLATGVTVTNTDTLTRNKGTKYLTRPQTPVTAKPAVSIAGEENFSLPPQPSFTFDFPTATYRRAWHASLPRPAETRRAPRDATLPRQHRQLPETTTLEKSRRSSSLELILSPMIQSTLRPSLRNVT